MRIPRRGYHTTTHEGKRYDVSMLIALAEKLPVHEVPLSTLSEYLASTDCWTNERGDHIGPAGIIALATKYRMSWTTMMMGDVRYATHIVNVRQADLSYPILRSPNGEILDGIHRLTKAFLEKRATILVKQFPAIPAEAEAAEKRT